MRTTIDLDDGLAKALKRRALEQGSSFKSALHEALRRGLVEAPRPRRFKQKTFSLGGARPEVDLDRVSALADRIEEGEISRKLAERR
jgi:hypothetical protein